MELQVDLNQSLVDARKTQSQVERINQELKSQGLKHKGELGQNDFLTLLVAQLKHQDPLSPMKDRDFIAQMAQFSSLEEMTQMNQNMKLLIRSQDKSGLYPLLGKQVTWVNTDTGTSEEGRVDSIYRKEESTELGVGNRRVRPEHVIQVHEAQNKEMDRSESVHRNVDKRNIEAVNTEINTKEGKAEKAEEGILKR